MPTWKRDSHVSLYYEIHGQGQPLLLIHGFMGTGRTEFPALRDQLARRYQVITPDLRGYGQSQPKPRDYPLDFYQRDAEDLAGLLAALDLSQVIVLGYSDGGEVALWLPILAPQRIAAVVTWGATGHFDASIKPAVLAMLQPHWRTPALAELHGAEHLTKMVSQWVQGMLGLIDAGGDITYSRAQSIACPCLILLGDRDELNPLDKGRAMAQAIPLGVFQTFWRTGHAVHTEHPWWFYWRVRWFLWRTGG